MDLSALIVVIVLAGSFFGFIVWMAIQSRKGEAGKVSTDAMDTGLERE